VPGGVIRVPLAGSGYAGHGRVRFRGHRVLTLQRGGKWYALVGLPLSLQPGRHRLSVRPRGDDAHPVTFSVKPAHYATQKIRVAPKLADPDPSQVRAIDRQHRRVHRVLNQWRSATPAFGFRPPVHGIVSSGFGLRRVINGQPRAPHGGLDIAAPRGTPVAAPAAGTVALVGHDYFYDGNTVVIDHGDGLMSLYLHLSSIAVKRGQHVTAGTRIGRIGATGLATGPHLHWGIALNGTMVDPKLFLTGPVRPRSQGRARGTGQRAP